jgi:threonine dehydrogenase-like Zn-dependent dehydrogenase
MRIKELTIINVRRSNQTLDDCVRLFSEDHGIFEKMISHTFSLEQIQKAFENNSAYADSVIKTVIMNK